LLAWCRHLCHSEEAKKVHTSTCTREHRRWQTDMRQIMFEYYWPECPCLPISYLSQQDSESLLSMLLWGSV
jgi:hypothetical protein